MVTGILWGGHTQHLMCFVYSPPPVFTRATTSNLHLRVVFSRGRNHKDAACDADDGYLIHSKALTLGRINGGRAAKCREDDGGNGGSSWVLRHLGEWHAIIQVKSYLVPEVKNGRTLYGSLSNASTINMSGLCDNNFCKTFSLFHLHFGCCHFGLDVAITT